MTMKTGTFTGSTSTGNQAITGLGFQPTLVMIVGTSHAAVDSETTGYGIQCFGVSDGTTDFGTYTRHFGTGSSFVWNDLKIITMKADGGAAATRTHEATVASLDSDGFTLNWTTTDSTTIIYHYVAYDFPDVKVLTGLTSNTSIGTKAYTGAGFQPNFMWLTGTLHQTDAPFASSTSLFSVGVTDGTNEANCSFNGSTGSISSHAFSGAFGSTTYIDADFSSFDSDGFTLNWTQVAETRYFCAVCIRTDDNIACGTTTISTTDTTKAVTGVGFLPVAGTFFGVNQTALTDATSGNMSWCHGAYDGITDLASMTKMMDSNLTTKRHSIETRPFGLPAGGAGAFDTHGNAAFSSFDSDGYTLDWSNVDGSAYYYIYVMIGPSTTFERSASNVLVLTQTLDSNIKLESPTTALTINQALSSNIFLRSAETQLAAIQTLTSFTLTTQNIESILTIVQRVGRTYEESVAHVLSVAQDMYRSHLVTSVLTITSTATGIGTKVLESNLNLVQAVTKSVDRFRNVSHTLNIQQTLLYNDGRGNLECLYSPLGGEDGIPGVQPTLGTAVFQMVFGATTLVLRNPDFGNEEQMAYQRINRRSRGGDLIVYADPNWPKPKTQKYTISNLSETQKEEFISFVDLSLGGLITLTDHHNRQWTGFIATPDLEITHVGICNYSISFEFEGDLV